MNKTRRKRINYVINNLLGIINYNSNDINFLKTEIENILWEEEDAYDNMPENLQYSIRGEESSEAINNLQEALESLEEAIDLIINNANNINEIDEYINKTINSLEEIY